MHLEPEQELESKKGDECRPQRVRQGLEAIKNEYRSDYESDQREDIDQPRESVPRSLALKVVPKPVELHKMNRDDGESDHHCEHEDNDQTENRLFYNKCSLSDILAGQALATRTVPDRLSAQVVGLMSPETLTVKRVSRDVQPQW